MGNLENTTSEELKYVTHYHAIDWIAGLVDKLSPMYLHDEIEQDTIQQLDKRTLKQKREYALVKLNTMIQSNRLTIYAKPFEAIFARQATSNFNTPDISLDYPDYIIDREHKNFAPLPHISKEDLDELEYKHTHYASFSFSQIKNCRRIITEIGRDTFSFGLIDPPYNSFYFLNKDGLDIWYDLEPMDCKDISFLHIFFFSTEELKEAFSSEATYKTAHKSGAPKKYYAEISLLKFLEQSQDKFTPEEKNKFANFLEKLNFEEITKLSQNPKTKKEKQKLKTVVDNLYPEQSTLNEIINEIRGLGISIDDILDITHKNFCYTLTETEYSSKKTLDSHFNEIKSALNN